MVQVQLAASHACMQSPIRCEDESPCSTEMVLLETVVTMAVINHDGKTVVRRNMPSPMPVLPSEIAMNDNGKFITCDIQVTNGEAEPGVMGLWLSYVPLQSEKVRGIVSETSSFSKCC